MFVQLSKGVFTGVLKTHIPLQAPAGPWPSQSMLGLTECTHSHFMSSEGSGAEWRQGHGSSSAVSCVAVRGVERRCLSGPMTVSDI